MASTSSGVSASRKVYISLRQDQKSSLEPVAYSVSPAIAR